MIRILTASLSLVPAFAQSTYSVTESLSSSMPAHAFPIAGGVATQLQTLNDDGPPPFGAGWSPVVRRGDLNAGCAFFCGDSTPCFISANEYMVGADEMTYDWCTSAWYRFTFELPSDYLDPVFDAAHTPGSNGRGVNVDDLGVCYLNGVRISARAVFNTSGSDAAGSLTWPTRDSVFTSLAHLFRPGTNELIFGVFADDGANIEPSGVEFRAQLRYERPVYTSYCSSGPNSTGQAATISAVGVPILSNDDLVLRAQGVPDSAGLFLYSRSAGTGTLGNGQLCVGGSIRRLLPVVIGSGGVATRSLALPGDGVTVGDHYFQYWFRDSVGLLADTSDGARVVFVP